MKSKRLFLTSLVMIATSFCLTGCLDFFINGKGTEQEFTGEKTELEYDYSDYSKNSLYESDYCPLSGTPKLLVIPTWFTDSDNYISNKANVKADIETAYFGSASSVGWNSVTTYYSTLSSGKVNLTGIVTDWWNSGYSSSYAAGLDNSGELVKAAATWYFSSHSGQQSTFDTDRNGYLDGVMLIYAAPNCASRGSSSTDNMWAYCYWTDNYPNKSTPVPGVFFWASYDFMYGSELQSYSRTGKSYYYYGDTSYSTLDPHTYIHEMGHVFGLEDYYDYSPNSYSPAGGFTMQDMNVASHDPFSVMALGWANPYIVNTSCSITIKPFQTSKDLVLLTPSWNSYNSPFDEYLLLEFYSPTGLNEFDSQHNYTGNSAYRIPNRYGIRVWHVDARLISATVVGDNYYVNANFSSNPTRKNSLIAMSNSYTGDSETDGYISPLGEEYENYNLLQLIRNDKNISHKTTRTMSNSDLFYAGDSFSFSAFSRQFVKKTFNNGKAFNLKFKVNSITHEEAIITITKG